MSEAPKRIGICPIHKTWHREHHETDWNYIRADLVEAAIKRALEGAANMIRDGMDDSEWYNPVRAIRALDPAQFIEEEKE